MLICVPFVAFSCLLLCLSLQVPYGVWTEKNTFLVAGFRWKAFTFLPFSIILATGLPCLAFIMFLISYEEMLAFAKGIVHINWNDHVTSSPQSMYSETLTDLHILKFSCIPGLNPVWSWHTFYLLLNLVSKYQLGKFCIYIHGEVGL